MGSRQMQVQKVMEERRVTVEGVTRQVPSPFLVVATQNPAGSAGTQPLPEAQMDRFMISLTIGYPDFESELAMAMGIQKEKAVDRLCPVMEREGLEEIQREICRVHVEESVCRYLLELVRKTRENEYLERGGSPRATIALVQMARAAAWLEGRSYVIPEDVEEQFPYIIQHRIRLSPEAGYEGLRPSDIVEKIRKSVKKPPLEKAI